MIGEEHVAASLKLLGLSARRSIRGLGLVPPRGRRGRCPIVDTWWQTETEGYDFALPARPRSSPGCDHRVRSQPALSMAKGRAREQVRIAGITTAAGQMRTSGDHERFFQTYFTTYPGDFQRRRPAAGEDGYYDHRADRRWHHVSGHRRAPPIEARCPHHSVAKRRVVGCRTKSSQGIYAYVR